MTEQFETGLTFAEGLTYDDILLIPQYSEIESRSKIDLSVQLSKGIKLKIPIVPANMKTITSYDMAEEIFNLKGMAVVHRFMPIEDQIELATKLVNRNIASNPLDYVGFSVGVKPEDYDNLHKLIKAGVKIICIDIAHGDSLMCVNMIKYIASKYPNVFLIAGNVATYDGTMRLFEAGADMVKVGIGPGCFAAGTRILMSNGLYKNIENIIPGDYVINKNGKSVKVLASFPTGTKNVVKLKNNSFYNDTYVTTDHQFWVGDLSSVSDNTLSSSGYAKILDRKSKTIPKQSKYKWKRISDAQNDVLLFPKNINFTMPETFNLSLNKRDAGNCVTGYFYSEDVQIVPNYDSGYLFGTFLGNGCASCTVTKGSHSGMVSWYFGKEEIDIANKVVKSIKSIFNKDAIIVETKNTIDVKFYYKPLADFLLTFDKKENKHLPANLFVNNKKYLTGLYDGLLDSDGHYATDGRKSVTSTSIKIIELFNVIHFMLNGHLPNNTFIGKRIGGLKGCNIDNMNEAYLSRTLKSGEKRLTDDYQIVKILKYEELNMEIPVYDITVDCCTHSFIANNMIVHNSLCTTRIETGNGVPQLTAIMHAYSAKVEFEHKTNKKAFIMADGGVKNSGDCVKALCYSDLVMAGNLFSGTDETPGTILTIDGMQYKEYVGSSTHKTSRIEGVAALVPTKGPVRNIVKRLCEGLQSGMAYQGVSNLSDLKIEHRMARITNAGLVESYPHDVRTK